MPLRPSCLGHHERHADARVVGQRHVPPPHPQAAARRPPRCPAPPARAGPPGRARPPHRPSAGPAGPPSALATASLAAKQAASEAGGAAAFALGEQPGRQRRGAAQRLFQAGDVDQVDADAHDHSPSLPRRPAVRLPARRPRADPGRPGSGASTGQPHRRPDRRAQPVFPAASGDMSSGSPARAFTATSSHSAAIVPAAGGVSDQDRDRMVAARPSARRWACSWSVASTMTRTARLGAARPDQHAAGGAEFRLRGGDRRGQFRRPGGALLVHPGDVHKHLRVPRHHRGQVRQRDPLPGGGREQVQGGEHAVAGGGVVEHDDVPGLLAADDEAARPASPPARNGRRPRSRPR